MNSIGGSNQIGYNHMPLREQREEKNKEKGFEVFVRSGGEEPLLNEAEVLRRMAYTRKIESKEGKRSGDVEDYNDLTLNGLGSQEIIYLGV